MVQWDLGLTSPVSAANSLVGEITDDSGGITWDILPNMVGYFAYYGRNVFANGD